MRLPRGYVDPNPPESMAAKSARLREEYYASAPQRREEILKISDPVRRANLLQEFDKEFAQTTAEGEAKRAQELEGRFSGAETGKGRRRKTRKTKKTRKSRKSRRAH